MAFVTSISEAPFHSGKADTHLDSAPEVPSVLFGASAVECDAIVRSRFPGGSEMNYNLFIVLDEFTEKEKTVLVAANNELDSQLLLGRTDFKSALTVLVAPSDTGLTVDSQINSAVTERSGIIYDDWDYVAKRGRWCSHSLSFPRTIPLFNHFYSYQRDIKALSRVKTDKHIQA